MKRRSFLRGSALLSLSSILPAGFSGIAGAQTVRFVDAVAATRSTVLEHLARQGYRAVEATSLATGMPHLNGGLRNWPPDTMKEPGHMVVQVVAKVDDIGERHRSDILPVFNLLICFRKSGDTVADAFDHQLRFLLDSMKLDRRRVTLISSGNLEALRPVAERHGIDWNTQVFLRDSADARAAGDGSGFVRIATPGGTLEAATIAFNYWLGSGPMPRLAKYPPEKGWTEVGETFLNSGLPIGFVVGVERLVLAVTGAYPTWNDYLRELARHVEASKDPHALKTLRRYRRS